MDTKPISILVIDGDATSRNYLTDMLQKGGYLVFTASLGHVGLISAWRDQPDIIILDPVLPDLPGLELVTRLRQDRCTSKVPCIALCSRQDSQDSTSLLSAGCNEYVAKSSQSSLHLLELIPRLLQEDSRPPKKSGNLIAILSTKGGTGMSSMCANYRHEPVMAKFPNDSSTFTLKQAANHIAELGQRSQG